MLTLFLLRHAKSDWADNTISDFDRPLAPRGAAAAETMADFIVNNHLVPDLVLCSTARRARHTLLPIVAKAREPFRVEFRRDLYDHSETDYIEIIRGVGDAPRLMILAHNSATEVTAASLLGEGDALARADLATKYPTAALTEITFPYDSWSEITSASGRLVRFIKPRELTNDTTR